ncbi:MAG TPA: hypothetical protein VLJ39_08540, partial [Tepidisphaeraceae bacterium]|nr:hypothetical protein [Tepidisphaeraceae bacterium]
MTELWVAELDSNRTEPLMPGLSIGVPEGAGAFWSPGYDISPDGRQIVFFSPDKDGKLRLWLTPLDRRSPPRQIPGVEGEQPLFGPTGEIFFRRVEGSSGFLYSVREDGTGLRRAAVWPVIDLFGAYPDRKWLLLGVPAEKGETLLPIGGGAPIPTHVHPPIGLRWTGDGRHLFVHGMNENRRTTYVLPLSPGQFLPSNVSLAETALSEADMAKLPGVRVIPAGDVVPGATADIYAFTRATVQRN